MQESRTNTISKLIGTIFTVMGAGGLVYAAMCQFRAGMNKNAAAGILLFSIVVTFIGVVQLYKKNANDYYSN